VTDQTITSISRETRVVRPSAEFKAQANLGSEAQYKRLYAESVNTPEKFWGRQAKELLAWRKPFKKVLQWKLPHAKWFEAASSMFPRTASTATWRRPGQQGGDNLRGRAGRRRTLTYRQLHQEVCKMANASTGLGLVKGDRVAIYMPMVPEAAIAMLACARLGVIHTSSSAASPARRSRTASTTARRGSSSPPTAAGAAARSSS
jgi:acetyl-CoA synthetase